MTPISILIIDDEPMNFDVIEALLNSGGGISSSIANASETINQDYQLHYAASGEEAITSLEIICPTLILLDVMMPEVNGLQVCKQIRSMPAWSTVPIIMVTALTGKQDLADCLEAGANDFISKPINCLELRARVGSMLRIQEQYQQISILNEKLEQALQRQKARLNMTQVSLDNQIHERLTAEHSLRLNESQFRALISNTSDLIFLIDLSGEVCYISPSVSRNLGYSPVDVANQSFRKWIHPQDQTMVDHFVDHVINAPDTSVATKLRWHNHDGQWSLHETIAQKFEDNTGFSGIVLNIRGVQDRLECETLYNSSNSSRSH